MESELAALDVTTSGDAFQRQGQEIWERVQDWLTLLRVEPRRSRQLLRKLFVGRLAFTPRDDGFIEYKATCSVGKLLEGIVLSKGFKLPSKTVVAPTGCEPVVASPSWAMTAGL
jgi:hypothetical protein